MKRQYWKHGIISICMIGLFLLRGSWFLTHAGPQQDQQTKKLVGAWRLVSVEGTGPNFHYAFDRPTGMVIYDPSGWMSVQIAIKGNRKPFASGIAAGTPEEKAAAFDSYVSYYGTYTLDSKAQTVTHHLEDSSIPGERGISNVRWFEFQDNNRLLLIPVGDGKGGVIARENATYKLLWERIE